MKGAKRVIILFGMTVILFVSGCASMGPGSVTRDRFNYIAVLSDSWKQQMMLNLLKVRYTDVPIFMDISSVISAYELTGEVTLGGQFSPPSQRGDTFGSVGGRGLYSDKPTISYQPLAGEKFTRSLMLPIPLPAILSLIESGYPADLVLRLCVNSINNINNAYGGHGSPREGDPKFREIIMAIRESQDRGGMGMRMRSAKDKEVMVMFLRPSTDEAIAEPLRKIHELLGLNKEAREVTIVYGSYPENDREIAMLSRSVLQVLVDLASYIDVPADDLAQGSVYGLQRTPEQKRLFPPLLTVRCGPSQPGNSYVSVKYRNQWFWIEDRNLQSKQIFNFLMFMFSLTETGGQAAAPILTIPAR